MSNVIGLVLWSAVIVILSPHYTLIEDSNMTGGYLLILLIYYISRSQLAEAQRSKEFTFTYSMVLLMIFNNVAGLLIPYMFPK